MPATRLRKDPGAAHSAKNATAPGLPSQSANDVKGRTLMVDAPVAGDLAVYGEIATLLDSRPLKGTSASDRVAWLFKMAHLLRQAGRDNEADHATDAGLKLVCRAVAVAGGELQ